MNQSQTDQNEMELSMLEKKKKLFLMVDPKCWEQNPIIKQMSRDVQRTIMKV